MSGPTSSVGYQNSKKDFPLRLIVSSWAAVTHWLEKELARILTALVGHSLHDIRNTKHFVEQLKNIRFDNGECTTSCDVKALLNKNENYTTEHQVHPKYHCPSRVLPQEHISCSRVSIMNKFREQPWGHP